MSKALLVESFKNASMEYVDELDFFMELVEQGISLDDIKNYAPDYYDYSYEFMYEHGLI